MLRHRPLATVIAAFAVLACVLLFAPFAATQSGKQTLTLTPPVTLAPAPSNPTSTTTTTSAAPRLPKTGLDMWLVTLVGLGLIATGVALRGARGGPASRWRG